MALSQGGCACVCVCATLSYKTWAKPKTQSDQCFATVVSVNLGCFFSSDGEIWDRYTCNDMIADSDVLYCRFIFVTDFPPLCQRLFDANVFYDTLSKLNLI